MQIAAISNCRTQRSAAPRHRRGTSSLDALMAFTLIVTAISVVTPLIVRHGRLLKSQHDYRLALDELSNQLEQLTALPPDQLGKAVEQLKPSEFITARLPVAEMKADLQPAEGSTRITLSLTWRDIERNKAPLLLAGWASTPPATGSAGQGGQP